MTTLLGSTDSAGKKAMRDFVARHPAYKLQADGIIAESKSFWILTCSDTQFTATYTRPYPSVSYFGRGDTPDAALEDLLHEMRVRNIDIDEPDPTDEDVAFTALWASGKREDITFTTQDSAGKHVEDDLEQARKFFRDELRKFCDRYPHFKLGDDLSACYKAMVIRVSSPLIAGKSGGIPPYTASIIGSATQHLTVSGHTPDDVHDILFARVFREAQQLQKRANFLRDTIDV